MEILYVTLGLAVGGTVGALIMAAFAYGHRGDHGD